MTVGGGCGPTDLPDGATTPAAPTRDIRTDSPLLQRVALRPLARADEHLLRDYLYLALYVPVGQLPPPASVLESPEIARYAVGWGRTGDCGVLAYEHPSGRDIGAAWLRLWGAGDTGYGFVDASTPELSMAVRPEWRGRGVGTLLLKRLLEAADRSYAAVSLSVSVANSAARLYERFGFAPVTSSGGSTTMLRRAGLAEADGRTSR